MRPIVLLDVDGVLNVLGEASREWGRLKRGFAVAEGRPFPITWAPPVVERFRDWIDGGVDVRWLTTWGHDANFTLRRLLGLPELPVAGTYDGQGAPSAAGPSHASVAPAAPDPLTGRWWKYDVVTRLLVEEPDAVVIWIDDELRPGTEFRAWADGQERVHAIGPSGAVGLTAAELEEIEGLLSHQT